MDDCKCNTCGELFDEPKLEEREDGAVSVCPFCGSGEWGSVEIEGDID